MFAVEFNGPNLGSGYFRRVVDVIYRQDSVLAE